MRIILKALLALMVAGPCLAQGEVFSEDFSAGDAPGWTVLSGGRNWRVQEGRYIFDGEGWGRYRTLAPVAIVDGTISFTATPLAESAHEPPWASFGVIVKRAGVADSIIVRFGAYDSIALMRWQGAERTIKHIGTLDAEVGREYRVRIEVEGESLRVFVDDKPAGEATIGMAGEAGRVGLYTETRTAFDDFRVEGAVEVPGTVAERIEGTPRATVDFAAWQPDPLQPQEALPVRGQMHLYVRNTGDGPLILDGASWDGRDADTLVRAGRLAWYHQHPYRIEPGEVGRVSFRLQGITEQQALALMADPEATFTVPVCATRPRSLSRLPRPARCSPWPPFEERTIS